MGFLITLLFYVLILGLVWWFVNKYVPIPQWAKTLLLIIFILIIVWQLLGFIGIFGFMHVGHRVVLSVL